MKPCFVGHSLRERRTYATLPPSASCHWMYWGWFAVSFLPEEDWIFRHPSVAEYNPTSGEYCQLTALIIDNSLFWWKLLGKIMEPVIFFSLHLGQMLKSVKLSKWDRNVWLISNGSQMKERWKGGWRGYFVNNFNSMKYDLNHKQVF